MKLLAWALLILAVLWLLRARKGAGAPASATSAGVAGAGKGTEAMVLCAHCGTYVPASESIGTASGTSYCSEEHRLRHAAAR